jgi:hypothetical protein
VYLRDAVRVGILRLRYLAIWLRLEYVQRAWASATPLIAQCEEIDMGWLGLKDVGNFAVNGAFY